MRWKLLRISTHKIGIYEYCMVLLVGAGTLLRFVLIGNNWPTTNSDEATMGLMALHIAQHGEHPIFYYGQAYMGALEAYVGALFFQVFGASLLTLRLGLLPFYALFLIGMYFLTRLLYNKQLALATVALLSLGSSEMMIHQLRAIGGYPEIVMFAVMIFLIASQLALSAPAFQNEATPQARRRRWVTYALLGLLAGLAIWVDELILPFVATSTLLLWLFCRGELRGKAGLSLLAGLLIGTLPLIISILTSPLGNNFLTALAGLQHAGAGEMLAKHFTIIHKLFGALLIAFPAISGLNPLCQVAQFPLLGQSTAGTWQCVTMQGGWTLGYLILWGSASVLAGRAIYSRVGPDLSWAPRFIVRLAPAINRGAHDKSGPTSYNQDLIRQCARLLLLVSAGLTLLIYATSAAAALYPGPTSRYLLCMQVATPAVLWPLWNGLGTMPTRTTHTIFTTVQAYALQIVRVALLLLVATMFIVGTIRAVNDVSTAQADYQQKQALMHDLLRIGATRIYTEYWTCNNLIFESNERIICSNLDEELRPGFDRYLPYRDMVKATPGAIYVFPSHSAQAATLEQKLLAAHIVSKRYEFDGYVVYQTETQVEA